MQVCGANASESPVQKTCNINEMQSFYLVSLFANTCLKVHTDVL